MVEAVRDQLVESLEAFREGKHLESLAAANRALTIATERGPGSLPRPLLERAYRRKAAALTALGDPVQAVRVYRQGVRECGPDSQLAAPLRLALDDLPATWHAAYWAARVAAGEAPAAFSSRDGRRLRAVPASERLAEADLRDRLTRAFEAHAHVLEAASDLAAEGWAAGRREPGRAALAFVRGWAYVLDGNFRHAARDGRFAVVYGPRGGAGLAASKESEEEDADEDGRDWMEGLPWLPAAQSSTWPAVLLLLSSAYEGGDDHVRALLLAALALERAPVDAQDGLAGVAKEAVEKLSSRVPAECAEAVEAGGSEGLLALLSRANLASKPEIHRRRPKYYYYYEWMKKRILDQYPALPEPVMDKLLTIDASELDLVLQYPEATRKVVSGLQQVLEDKGAAALETYRVPLLSWEEVKALEGPDTIGLPLGEGRAAPKQLPEATGGTAHLLEAAPPALEAAEVEIDEVDAAFSELD